MWTRHLILVSLTTVACSGGSTSEQHDAGAPSDAQLTLPAIPPGCPPSGGNEVGIGSPCTATGSECPGNLQCSCKSWFGYEMPPSMPCFCTSVTFGSACGSSCGSNATCCTYDIPLSGVPITISACFPTVCAPNNQCPSITQ